MDQAAAQIGRQARKTRPTAQADRRAILHPQHLARILDPPSAAFDVKASRAKASASPAPLASLADAKISEWNG